MNWQQFKALVWLRWRLFMVQFRKMNVGTRIFLGLLAAFVGISVVGGGLFASLGTIMLMPAERPMAILIVCDVMVAVFLLAWISGFITELQRSEPISIEKLLHLPVSVRGAFLLNYLSSFASLTVVTLLPMMIGVCVGLPFVYGWKTLLALPLLLAFLLAITALTYQVRGWLARMMSNPRRRRAIMAGLLIAFIGVSQIPGILATVFDNDSKRRRKADAVQVAKKNDQKTVPAEKTTAETETVETATAEATEELSPEEQARKEEERRNMVEERRAARKARRAAKRARAMQFLISGNRYFPAGWFPLGLTRAAEGKLWPGLAGMTGLLAIAATSLSMSYRATLNFYRGKVTSQARITIADELPNSARTSTRPAKDTLPLRPLPFLPPKLGMLARTNLTSLWRSPAVKMQLLVPFMVMFFPIFAVYKNREALTGDFAPLIGLGLVLFSMFMMFGMTMNIFGFDRHAFRCFMLLPIQPRELLLCKNISLLPFVCCSFVAPFAVLIFLFSPPWHHALASVVQLISAFAIVSTEGNLVSTLFPFPTPTSAMKRVKPRWQAVLAQIAAFFLFPFLMIPVAVPPLLDVGLRKFNIWDGFSLNLILSIFVMLLALGFYWWMLNPLSRLFWEKQRNILFEVTKSE